MKHEYGPSECGYATNIGGVIICTLGCRPCKEPCEKERQDKAFINLTNILMGLDKDGEQNEND